MGTGAGLVSYLPLILAGVPITVMLTVLSVALAIPTAVVLALGRMSRHGILRWPAGFLIEFLRGTSALVQLFWVYYVLPFFGIEVPPLVAGIVVLGLNGGSYFSEVVRAGLMAVPRGQREAAITLHFRPYYVFRHVILPQALPVMIPPFGNFAISMLKFTSLASLVTVHELSFRAGLVRLELGTSGPTYLLTLFIYFAIALLISLSVRQLERAVNKRSGRPSSNDKKPSASPIPAWAFGR